MSRRICGLLASNVEPPRYLISRHSWSALYADGRLEHQQIQIRNDAICNPGVGLQVKLAGNLYSK